ncbi:MAG: hypothetical protein F4029_08510 [Gammaproteobacteria bacterium]|nr:hypothetical protein [Gammaproteobacteria bacterium]
MSDTENRRRIRETPWNFVKEGSYGSFATSGSLPLEFIQTTFTARELSKLTFARDVSPDELDFEMLMQREIDEDRARKSLGHYLNPLSDPDVSKSWRAVFFPLLLIACVPAKSKVIREYYDEETWSEEANSRLIRRWGRLFQMEFYTTDSVGALYELESPSSDNSAQVDLNGVRVRFNLSDSLEEGVKLIAIDGQHRLLALRRLAEEDLDAVSSLVVPVCILFSTSATEKAREYRGNDDPAGLPGVPQTFRRVFVDVNSTVEAVGAHTTILLNDSNVGSLIVREFCRVVNERERKEGLSCVEWNVKGVKDSTKLTRRYSLTSIGIIELGLREFARGRGSLPLMRRLLDIDDVQIDERLRKLADDPDKPEITWDNFSLAQRSVLVDQVRPGIVELLYRIFFEFGPYKEAYGNYTKSLDHWKRKSRENSDTAADYKEAYETVTNFREPRLADRWYRIVRNFGRDQEDWRKEHISPVMHLALFQRSMFVSLRELMVALPDVGIETAGKGLLYLLDWAMDSDRGLFALTRDYTRMTIWSDTGYIITKENTRRQLSRLTLGALGAREEAIGMANAMEVMDVEKERVVRRLVEIGEEHIEAYWSDYTKDRDRHFRKAFETDGSLDEEERDALRKARAAQMIEDEERKAGRLSDGDADRPFDLLVRNHLLDEFDSSERHLRSVLRLEHRIVGSEFGDADEEEGDE